MGAGLGNFRNKTKSDNPPPVEVKVDVPRKKEEVQVWARKEREVKEDAKEKELSPNGKQEQPPQEKKKKKHYVLVGKEK